MHVAQLSMSSELHRLKCQVFTASLPDGTRETQKENTFASIVEAISHAQFIQVSSFQQHSWATGHNSMLRIQCEIPKNQMPLNAALYRFILKSTLCLNSTQIIIHALQDKILLHLPKARKKKQKRRRFSLLWINSVVKSYGARQFFNNLLKRCWSLRQRAPQMAHFITFHPIESTARWFEWWPFQLPPHPSFPIEAISI